MDAFNGFGWAQVESIYGVIIPTISYHGIRDLTVRAAILGYWSNISSRSASLDGGDFCIENSEHATGAMFILSS